MDHRSPDRAASQSRDVFVEPSKKNIDANFSRIYLKLTLKLPVPAAYNSLVWEVLADMVQEGVPDWVVGRLPDLQFVLSGERYLGLVVVVVVAAAEAVVVVVVGTALVHCLVDKGRAQIGDSLLDTDHSQMPEHPLMEVFVTCDYESLSFTYTIP